MAGRGITNLEKGRFFPLAPLPDPDGLDLGFFKLEIWPEGKGRGTLSAAIKQPAGAQARGEAGERV